jgi:hypothetical protein
VIDILLALIIFAILIALMAVGVLMGRKPISGSCGGVGAALGEKNYNCEICGGDTSKCDEATDQKNIKTTFTELTVETKND